MSGIPFAGEEMLISLLGIMTVLGKFALGLFSERALSISSPRSYSFLDLALLPAPDLRFSDLVIFNGSNINTQDIWHFSDAPLKSVRAYGAR